MRRIVTATWWMETYDGDTVNVPVMLCVERRQQIMIVGDFSNLEEVGRDIQGVVKDWAEEGVQLAQEVLKECEDEEIGEGGAARLFFSDVESQLPGSFRYFEQLCTWGQTETKEVRIKWIKKDGRDRVFSWRRITGEKSEETPRLEAARECLSVVTNPEPEEIKKVEDVLKDAGFSTRRA